jgi:hypothetical protein
MSFFIPQALPREARAEFARMRAFNVIEERREALRRRQRIEDLAARAARRLAKAQAEAAR